VLATCTGDTGLDGLARVLEGFGLGDGVLWVGSGEVTAVGSLQRGRRRGDWVRAVSSVSSHVARLGSGQRELGSTAEVSTSMATGLRRTTTVMLTVNSIFSDFCLPGVRHNARKKFEFKILKMATVVRPHIGQGF
jgi:hypothetical protein